ncbi:hypothetical protein [Streptomyces sp. NBC_01481]|uniref:hypothetical protein n=1 Tax=Streptomyces sp. NBC_01481 TaxID=2975869 RepID=UPI002253B477|nr:hypothetical protein [Streptomyces sp. NBC_01481]MCX4583365.1 hypothetical protein [Streptomyces sp. NBC_01481]
MRDGGSSSGEVDGTVDEPAEAGRFQRLRKHRLLASGVAVVVLAAGVAIPLAFADSDDIEPCWRLPASARALADNPGAAARALDPGEDLARLGSAKRLLAHEKVCGDGARVLGRIVDGATRSTGPGRPHTMAQARTAYAVASALDGIELPAGLAPGVARMVAEYVVDAGRDDSLHDDDLSGPALPPEEARLDETGWVWLGRFLAPEAHAAFGYADRSADADADIEELVAELAKDPQAFAILYDAERAYLAYYLERLTAQGGDPAHRPTRRGLDARYASKATTWTDNDPEDVADRIGDLMKFRADYTRDGTIPGLAAFDASVHEHIRGTFRPAPVQLNTRPPMGDIAGRPVAGPVRGDLMNGRHQMFTVLDDWAKKRKVPPKRAAAMRQLLDDAYVRALWLRF